MIATPIPEGRARATFVVRTSSRSRSALAAAYDAELVRQFNAGDEAAFAEIVARFRDRIFATAFSFVRDRGDAEDITQDTFIRAHRGLARFRGDSSLATWLYRITTNLSRNLYWHLVRRGRHITASLDCPVANAGRETINDLFATDASSPSRLAAYNEFSAIITACMDKLEARHREILMLRAILDQSYGQIASELGIEVGTVKSRLARARGSLHRLITERCPEFTDSTPLSDWFEPRHAGSRVRHPT